MFADDKVIRRDHIHRAPNCKGIYPPKFSGIWTAWSYRKPWEATGFPVPLALMSRIFKESQGFRELAVSSQVICPRVKNFNIARYQAYPFDRLICIKKAGVKNITGAKIEFSYNKMERIGGLDDLARILFPGSKNHQKIFLAIYIELKYAPDEFLPSLLPLCDQYRFSPRMLETVRSKMRRMGIIDHVSRFNKTHKYREGWIFSHRFVKALAKMTNSIEEYKNKKDGHQQQKDRDLFQYL